MMLRSIVILFSFLIVGISAAPILFTEDKLFKNISKRETCKFVNGTPLYGTFQVLPILLLPPPPALTSITRVMTLALAIPLKTL
jgi:hypothetical protein